MFQSEDAKDAQEIYVLNVQLQRMERSVPSDPSDEKRRSGGEVEHGGQTILGLLG